MEDWVLIGRVKRAKNRYMILKSIPRDRHFLPSELVKIIYSKSSNTYFNIVSRALKELESMGLVKVLNPQERIGRLYRLTKKGIEISKIL